MAASRRQLRRWIGRTLGEGRVLTATASSSAAEVIDANRLAVEDQALRDFELIAAAGTAANLGQVRRVAANSKTGASLALAAPLPAPVAAGDEFELWNERGYGVSPDAVHDQINFLIDAVKELNETPVTATVAFSAATPELAIPAGWDWFYGADWNDAANARWAALPWNQLAVDAPLRSLRLTGRLRWRADAATLRLRGGIDARPLLSDDDETTVDAEWLVKSAVALLTYARAHRVTDPSAAERKVNFVEGLVGPLRSKAWQRRPGRAWRLR